MSAKQIVFFFPIGFGVERVIPRLVGHLGLEFEELPAEKSFSFQVSAVRGRGRSLLLMEYSDSASEIIEELSEWESPSTRYKELLLACKSSITFYYRDVENGRDAILALALAVQEIADECVVENGDGCLLILSSMVSCLEKDMNWSWERMEFPDLPDVGASEWQHND